MQLPRTIASTLVPSNQLGSKTLAAFHCRPDSFWQALMMSWKHLQREFTSPIEAHLVNRRGLDSDDAALALIDAGEYVGSTLSHDFLKFYECVRPRRVAAKVDEAHHA
jgi:hypothetical protein